MIDRRKFLTYSGALAAGSTLGLPLTRAHAAETITGVTYLPPSYKALTAGSAGFVEQLEKNHADVVDIDFHDSGRLLAADEQLPALRAGNIDFMFHTTSYVTRSLPILGVLGLPGVVNALYENPERLKRGSPLFNLINEQLEDEHGLYMLSVGGNILQPEYIWSTESDPVRTLDDLDGKKVRVVGYEATGAIEAFGGASVRIPSSELYLALQRGTVDAAVCNISTVVGRSLQEQLGQVLRVPVTAFGIGIFVTTDHWAGMSDDVKEAMTSAAEWFDENSARMANEDFYEDEYWPMMDEAGVEVIEPDQETLDRFAEVSEDVREEWIGEVGQEVGERAITLAEGEDA